MAYNVVIARQLGTAGAGVLVLAWSISKLLAEASDLGLDYGILRLGSIAHGTRDRDRFRAVVHSGVVGSLVTGTIAGVALAAGASLMATLFKTPGLTPVLIPLAASVPFTAGAEVVRSGFRAMGDATRPVASTSIIAPSLRLATCVWALSMAPTATAAAWAWLITEALVFVITGAMLWRRLPAGDRHASGAEGLYRFSLPMSLNRVLLYGNNQTEVFFLPMFTSVAAVGVFGISRRLSVLVGSLLTSVSVLFNPVVADLHHAERTDELGELYRVSTRWLLTLGLPVCLVEVLFPTQILAIFGKDFTGGATALMILAVGQLINVGTGTSANLQAMAGHAKVTLLNSGLFLSMSIVLDLLLIPPFGLMGAAVANTTTLIAVNVLRFWQIHKTLGFMPYDRTFLRPLVAAIPAGIAAVFIPLPQMRDVVDLLVRTVVLGIVYLLALYALGIEPIDREIGRAGIARIRGRLRSAPTTADPSA
jgi:O-antigen/teichoic acid export membrane protein